MNNPNGPRAKILVCIPNYLGMMTYRMVESLTQAQLYCIAKRVHMEVCIAARMTLIEYARAYLAARFLASDFTHMMCIDDDLGFEPTSLMRMLERDKDIIAGVYPVKTIPIFYPYKPLGAPQADGLQQAEHVPGGFLLIKRHVMEKLASEAQWFDIEHDNHTISAPDLYSMPLEGKNKVGEDIAWCDRARKAGFDIWVEPNVGFVHCGYFEWGGNLQTQLNREAEAQAAAEQVDAAPRIVLPDGAGKVTPIAAAMDTARRRA